MRRDPQRTCLRLKHRLPSLSALALLAGLNACAPDQQAASFEWAASQQSRLIGRTSPAFTLPDQDDSPLSLSSLRGRWVVVYFYPRDDTPACTCQATEFTRLLQSFRDLNATVLGVSPDPPGDHRFFIEKYQLKITLLCDVDHKVFQAYGAWASAGDGIGGRVVRSTVLIDPAGHIVWHWPEVIPQGHADRVRQKLADLQHRPSREVQ